MTSGMSITDEERQSLAWRKSHMSSMNGACVEVAAAPRNNVALRDSKNPDGPVLLYTPEEWLAFLDGAKKGEFDDLVAPEPARHG